MAERVLISGDRNWKSLKSIYIALKYVLDTRGIECIIEGEARGADRLSVIAAKQLGLREDQILRFPAKWDEHGKSAGPIRNRQMLKYGRPTLLIAFHENIAQSKGTADMIRAAEAIGLTTILIDVALPDPDYERTTFYPEGRTLQP